MRFFLFLENIFFTTAINLLRVFLLGALPRPTLVCWQPRTVDNSPGLVPERLFSVLHVYHCIITVIHSACAYF